MKAESQERGNPTAFTEQSSDKVSTTLENDHHHRRPRRQIVVNRYIRNGCRRRHGRHYDCRPACRRRLSVYRRDRSNQSCPDTLHSTRPLWPHVGTGMVPYLLSCTIPYRPDQYDVVPLALEARKQGKIPAVAQWILAFRQRTFAPDRDDSPAGLKMIFDSLLDDYRQTVAARQNNLTILAISQAMITRQRLDWKADFEWWTLRMFFPTTQDDCSPSFYFSNCCDRCIVSSRSPPHQADHLPHHGRMSTPNSPRR